MDYLKLIIRKLYEDYSSGIKYHNIELLLLDKIIDLTLQLRLYDLSRDDKFFEKLEKVQILNWENILKIRKIKRELGRDHENNNNDEHFDELIYDLLQIGKMKGEIIFKRFVNLIKNKNINNLVLKYIVKKFKQNVWDLNESLIDTILIPNEPTKWVDLLHVRDKNEKNKSLSVQDLVTQMKHQENSGEINYNIKKLLERGPNCESSLEKCISMLEKSYEQSLTIIKLDENINQQTLISKLTIDDIKLWATLFKNLNSTNVDSIEDPIILELVSVISRASEIVNKFRLRLTQQMALLIFIDSILNEMKGRLANISTGEGKSLITISTTIAQIMLKGGNVDVLTSSEVLAERDAEESKEMFSLFCIKVSNNCDAKAEADESVRRDRYAKNEVIYGEIGHFQRDLLLTKYYNKNIRHKLANCLIVDEVDSMCIDKMCNTLYISHQIADLRELKDIYVYIWQAVNARDCSKHTAQNISNVESYINKLITERIIRYPSNLDAFVKRRLKIWINNAYMASLQIEEGYHYSVLDSGKK